MSMIDFQSFCRRFPVLVNAGALALLSFVESAQVLIILALVFSFIPIATTDFVHRIFPVYLPEVRPEREMPLYRLFVATAIGLQACLVWFFRRRLDNEKFCKSLLAFAGVSGVWVFVQLFAVVKILLLGNPWWARGLLYAGIAAALVCKIFWWELKHWARPAWAKCLGGGVSRWLFLGDVAVVGLIFLIIYVPDVEKVLARAFIVDRFYHIDGFLMAPAWAYLSGLKLNMDVITQYGCVHPALFGRLAVSIGGFTYQNILLIFIWGTIVYYWILYAFLRVWLGWRLLAAIGALTALKCQMFHWGVMPIIWQFLTPTVLRYFLDGIFLYLLWQHINTVRPLYLWLCASLAGLALSYMMETGLYLTGAFGFYIALCVCWPSWRGRLGKGEACLALVVPFVLALAVLYAAQGPSLLTKAFWANTFEHMGMFLQGWGALPVTDAFKAKFYYPVFKGLLIPMVYVWTMVTVASLCFLKRMEDKHLFIVVICAYGLGLYHYYIVRSAVTSYEVVGIPFVLVLCFWAQELLTHLTKALRVAVCAVMLAGVLGALGTNTLFTFYPNVFDLAHNDWNKEKDFFHQQSDCAVDAGLIRDLVPPDGRAAVISSFETQMLMAAGRRPFFYYFPLLESSHWGIPPEFRRTYLHTRLRMQKTLDQMEERKPAYIFVEKRLFFQQIPESFATLNILMRYLKAHYQPYLEGQHLVALRRMP